MKKIELAAERFKIFQTYFKCSLCGGEIILNNKSLVCREGHCFDLAKSGYVNLVPQADQSAYTKTLFNARRLIYESGFFQPLIDYLVSWLPNCLPDLNFIFLDAGCGEGSLLISLIKALGRDYKGQAFGIDIAKEGIKAAAAADSPVLWCVADLARLPLRDKCFDLILNILSPANYGEFSRVLKKEGYIIKVVPEQDYLREIRSAAFCDQPQSSYSNRQVTTAFKEEMILISQEKISYKRIMNEKLLTHLLEMTPLTLGLDKAALKAKLEPEQEVTCSFCVLIGKNKN